jgi:hypothetical protein
MTSLNKGQTRQVAMIEAWLMVGAAAPAAASLSAEIRMARRQTQKDELFALARRFGLINHPKFIA